MADQMYAALLSIISKAKHVLLQHIFKLTYEQMYAARLTWLIPHLQTRGGMDEQAEAAAGSKASEHNHVDYVQTKSPAVQQKTHWVLLVAISRP